ncbi:MAG: hypothetical protein ACP5HS_14600, partial [Anaerolineae bacterium]
MWNRSSSVQQRFAERCSELLETMVSQAREKDPWKIYLAKGAGDRAIAGDHEERHLLELLQNARDAIFRGHSEGIEAPGRVLVAVTEHGMAMANTGSPFHLNDEDVLEAVRFLMRSDKVGKGFVGHKGIGLKSILLRAGAFSVRTRIDGDVLRASFSRYRTARHLLDRIATSSHDFPHQEDILTELSRMPLFTQPHADDAGGAALGDDTALVESLINGSVAHPTGLSRDHRPAELTPYTTVVYLPYADDAWERLLDEVKAKLPQDRRDRFHREQQQMGTSRRAGAEALWKELMALDPRVFVLLGEISEIQFVRFAEGELVEGQRIDIDRPLSPLNDVGLATRMVEVRGGEWHGLGEQTSKAWTRSFTILSAPTALGKENEKVGEKGPQEYVRILLEVPGSDPMSLRNEPLFLYYPIDSSLSGLPFLIHGPFRVNSSRTELAASEAEHNRRVLLEAVRLLEERLPSLLEEGPLRAWLPWVLLPQVGENEDAWASRDGLQRWLVTEVFDLLRKMPCAPTVRGRARPSDVHFLPEHPGALALLEDLHPQGHEETSGLCLLAPDSRLTYQRLHEHRGAHWEGAARTIGLGQMDRTRFASALVEDLKRVERRSPWRVDAERARAFFLGLCAFLVDETRKVDEVTAAILGQEKVPLLPVCQDYRSDQEGATSLLLVSTEPREIGGGATEKAGRVVFWRPTSREARTEDLPPPPAAIPVYFIDPEILEVAPTESVLARAGRAWGTARFEGRPDLFRRVADETAKVAGPDIASVLGYLAGLLQSIRVTSFSGADDLEPRPYAAIDLPTLRNFVNVYHRSASQRTLDRQRLESLQAWSRILVPVHSERNEQAPAHTTAFGPEWAALLERAVEQMQTISQDDQDPPEAMWARAIRALTAYRRRIGRLPSCPRYPEVASPDDPCWQEAYERVREMM